MVIIHQLKIVVVGSHQMLLFYYPIKGVYRGDFDRKQIFQILNMQNPEGGLGANIEKDLFYKIITLNEH